MGGLCKSFGNLPSQEPSSLPIAIGNTAQRQPEGVLGWLGSQDQAKPEIVLGGPPGWWFRGSPEDCCVQGHEGGSVLETRSVWGFPWVFESPGFTHLEAWGRTDAW